MALIVTNIDLYSLDGFITEMNEYKNRNGSINGFSAIKGLDEDHIESLISFMPTSNGDVVQPRMEPASQQSLGQCEANELFSIFSKVLKVDESERFDFVDAYVNRETPPKEWVFHTEDRDSVIKFYYDAEKRKDELPYYVQIESGHASKDIVPTISRANRLISNVWMNQYNETMNDQLARVKTANERANSCELNLNGQYLSNINKRHTDISFENNYSM